MNRRKLPDDSPSPLKRIRIYAVGADQVSCIPRPQSEEKKILIDIIDVRNVTPQISPLSEERGDQDIIFNLIITRPEVICFCKIQEAQLQLTVKRFLASEEYNELEIVYIGARSLQRPLAIAQWATNVITIAVSKRKRYLDCSIKLITN